VIVSPSLGFALDKVRFQDEPYWFHVERSDLDSQDNLEKETDRQRICPVGQISNVEAFHVKQSRLEL